MKILLADDHHLILNGLVSVLEKQFPDSECTGVLNKTDLFAALHNAQFDILIQDLKFGTDNAKDFLDDLRKEFPSLKNVEHARCWKDRFI